MQETLYPASPLCRQTSGSDSQSTALRFPAIDKHQVQRAVKAQYDDQQCLYAMHYQCKNTGIRSIHPIKHHHGDDSKVPGTCPVGCGDYDGKCPTDKHHQPRKETEMFRKLEAIESNIEMIEVAKPDEQSIKQEQRDILYVPKGHHTFPNVEYHPLHLLEEREHAQQIIQQYQHPDNAEQDDIEPRRCHQMYQ